MSIFQELFSSQAQMWSLIFCASLIGMSKTGLQGINTVSIPLMAIAFGAKPSTGVILPMLCFADLVAVIYYRRHAVWGHIFRLLPMAVAGFFLAIYADTFVEARNFKYLIAACIFGGLLVMLWSGRNGKEENAAAASRWYAPLFGLLGGFSTMIGNAAGPVMAVYLLSTRLKKLDFVGTNAWFFLIVNYLKLPLQAFVWDNIDAASLSVGAFGVPFILAGAAAGVWLVKRLPERGYRGFVLAMTIVSTLAMFAEF